MLKNVFYAVREARYRALESKMSRIGYYRNHRDTDGQRLSRVVGGAAFFSERTNRSGDQLIVLVSDRSPMKFRATGFDSQRDLIVNTPADVLHPNVESFDEVAALSAKALREFLPHQSTSAYANKADSKQMRIHERNAISASNVRPTHPNEFC